MTGLRAFAGRWLSARHWRELSTTVLRGEGVGARFARGSLSSIAVNIAGAGMAFGVQVLLARAMGVADYGGYLYVLGLMNWVSLVARFQLDTSATRFVSEYRATGQWATLRAYVGFSQRVVAGNALFLGAAAAAIIYLTGFTRSDLRPALLAGVALLPANSLLVLTCSSLEGLQLVATSQGANFLLRPTILGLLVLLLWWRSGDTLTAAQGIWVNCVAATTALAFTWIMLRRALRASPPAPREPPQARHWLTTAVGFWWVAVAQQVLTPQTDLLVVGALLSKELAGAYGAASQLATLVGFGVNAVGAIGMPMIAQLYAQGRHDDLQHLVRHYTRINLALSVPVVVLVAVVGTRLLGVYGSAFTVAYPVLLLLSATQIVSAAVGVQAGYLLTMTGRERAAGRIVGISALTNLGLTLVLTPAFGIPGTAVATLVATLARALLLARHIRTELRIDLLGGLLGRRVRA